MLRNMLWISYACSFQQNHVMHLIYRVSFRGQGRKQDLFDCGSVSQNLKITRILARKAAASAQVENRSKKASEWLFVLARPWRTAGCIPPVRKCHSRREEVASLRNTARTDYAGKKGGESEVRSWRQAGMAAPLSLESSNSWAAKCRLICLFVFMAGAVKSENKHLASFSCPLAWCSLEQASSHMKGGVFRVKCSLPLQRNSFSL